MTVHEYIAQLQKRYQSGIAKEHAYRADLEQLLRTLAPTMEITNEPANVTDCGNPDFVVTKGKIPIGYIEAKDIGKDLNSKQYQEQFSRYRKALDNLIITDYLSFQFFRHDELVHEVRIGDIQDGKIVPLPEHFAYFTNLIAEFCAFIGQTITSASKLAELMAAKARLLQTILEQAVTSDVQSADQTALKDQLKAFQQILIHDLAPKEFADLYAQTLAYGLFAARLHDPSLNTFTRQEAAELIPKTNPFLRKLFQYILLEEIDERIKTTVDNLAEVFRAADVNLLLKHFSQTTQQADPVIHFYETFLAAYDPKLRKSRGVWYTPSPVVEFVVRAIDDLLQREFSLPQGLADTSSVTINVEEQGNAMPVKRDVHKVQFLDPGVGTGTFLVEIVKRIHATRFKSMQGAWSGYVEEHLLPRLNGFELLMAPYTMAHVKLDLLLQETGYQPKKLQRFNIYMTNTLEEYHGYTQMLFAQWLSAEANAASAIKRDAPIMVVLGNPPYAVSSANASIGADGQKTWIGALLDDYKKDLNEKKLNLDDDYIKFIRYGHHLIEKNHEGILAYISNNSFLDGITHRQMRKALLETFDKIYILDLHGSAKKQETTPDGGKDENVFDIMQGVSINIFVKTKGKKKRTLAEVYHCDLYGRRKAKYEFLRKTTIDMLPWQKLGYKEPYFFFVPKDFQGETDYAAGFELDELFLENNTGIQTKRDHLVYQFSQKDIKMVIEDMTTLTEEEIRKKYQLPDDGRDWSIKWAKEDIRKNQGEYLTIHYHPFDLRQTYFTGISKGFMAYPRTPLMRSAVKKNYNFLAIRNSRRGNVNNYVITKYAVDKDGVSPFDNCKFFPLYLYSDDSEQQSFDETPARTPNLNMAIVQRIADALGLRFAPEKPLECQSSDLAAKASFRTPECFAPLDLLDYIYAVLHSPTYRETYKEFLKIDFPRVPYPSDVETFWRLVKLGGELRQMHLLESPKVEQFITSYPKDGNNVVGKVRFDLTPNPSPKERGELGNVWINDAQYFSGVPQVAWEFYIGGYQPAQKWLKDRQGRTLSFEDILHYQKIIVALVETDRLMREIDAIPLSYRCER